MECKRTFPRATWAGDYYQFISGDVEIDILEVIDPDEENDIDVSSHVVFTDKTILAAAIDLNAFHGNIHFLVAMNNG